MKYLFCIVAVLLSCLAEARLPDLIPYRAGPLWGFCDSTKKIIIAPAWDEVTFFGGNAAAVKRNGRWGMIDRNGNILVRPQYNWISAAYTHGLRFVTRTANGRYGAINDSGRLVVNIQYDWLSWQGPYLQGARSCNVGVLDSNGHEVLPFRYTHCGDYPRSMGDSGLFALSLNGKWGVVDTNGRTVIPFQYTWISATDCGQFEVETGDFTSAFYNTNGEQVAGIDSCSATPVWRGYHQLVNGMQSFESNGVHGYRNAAGTVIYEPQFGIAHDFQPNGIAEVWVKAPGTKRGAATGYIDIYGTTYWED
jgi:hypothetical protein